MRALYSYIAAVLYTTYLTVTSCDRLVSEAEAILACAVVAIELAYDISSFAHITSTLATEKEREKEVAKQEEEEALKISSGVEAAVALPAKQQMFLQKMKSQQRNKRHILPWNMPNPMNFPRNPGFDIPHGYLPRPMNFPMNQVNTTESSPRGSSRQHEPNESNAAPVATPKPIESSKPTHDDEPRTTTARSECTQFSLIPDGECCNDFSCLVVSNLQNQLMMMNQGQQQPGQNVPSSPSFSMATVFAAPLILVTLALLSLFRSKRNDVDDGNNTSVCIVCLEHPRSHAFVPCGHMCLCDHCSSQPPYSEVRYSVRRTIFVSVIDAIRYSVRLIFRSTVLSRRGIISCPICRDSSSAIMKIYNS